MRSWIDVLALLAGNFSLDFRYFQGFLFIVVPSYTKSRLFQDVFRIFFVTDYFYQDKRDLIREVFVPILQIRLGQTWFTPYDSLL